MSLITWIMDAIGILTSNSRGAVVATLAEGAMVGSHFLALWLLSLGLHCWVRWWYGWWGGQDGALNHGGVLAKYR